MSNEGRYVQRVQDSNGLVDLRHSYESLRIGTKKKKYESITDRKYLLKICKVLYELEDNVPNATDDDILKFYNCHDTDVRFVHPFVESVIIARAHPKIESLRAKASVGDVNEERKLTAYTGGVVQPVLNQSILTQNTTDDEERKLTAYTGGVVQPVLNQSILTQNDSGSDKIALISTVGLIPHKRWLCNYETVFYDVDGVKRMDAIPTCTYYEKKLKHFLRDNKSAIERYENDPNEPSPIIKIMDPSGKIRTLVSEKLSIRLMMWVDQEFADVAISMIVKIMNGDLTLIREVVETHDVIHNTITDVGYIGGNENHGSKIVVKSITKESETEDQKITRDKTHESIEFALRQYHLDFSQRADIFFIDGKVQKIDKTMLSKYRPEQNLVAIFPECKPAGSATYHDLIRMMMMKIVSLYEETIRVGSEKNTLVNLTRVAAEQQKVIETLTAKCDTYIAAGKLKEMCAVCIRCNDNICKGCTLNRTPQQIDDLKRKFTRTAFTEVVANIMKSDAAELNSLGSLFVGFNLWPNAEAQLQIRDLIAVILDILGMLTATHSESVVQPTVTTDTWMEAKSNENDVLGPFARQYFESLYRNVSTGYESDEEDYGSGFAYDTVDVMVKGKAKGKPNVRRGRIAKGVKSMSDAARKAMGDYVIAGVNFRPVVAPSLEHQVITIYYGDSAFAPLVFPTGIAFGERRLYLQLTDGHIVNPGLHHLVYGGNIRLNDDVNTADVLLRVMTKFRNNISQYNTRQPATAYMCTMDPDQTRAPHHLVMVQIIKEIADAVLTVLMPDGRGASAKWRVWTLGQLEISTALVVS